MKLKKAATIGVVALGLVAQGVFIAGSASASSGGGCSGNDSVGGGWVIDSCISASGGYVHPDGYVTTGQIGAGCDIYVDLIKNGDEVAQNVYACTSGTVHVKGNWNYNSSGTYFTGIYVLYNNSVLTSEVTSPNELN